MPIQKEPHSPREPLQRLIDLIAHRIATRLHEKRSTSKPADSPDREVSQLKNNDNRVTHNRTVNS